MATIPTILVSDTTDEIRSKIESLIKSQPELALSKTIGKADAIKEIEGASSTIVWVELESGADEGLNLLKQLIQANPGSYFIVSKEELDADLVKRAMQAGALDFLDHRGWAAQIRSVVRRVSTKEWGSQKSGASVRSAIPSQNIKKSGAWAMPGKQMHKPTGFGPKPESIAANKPAPAPEKTEKSIPVEKAESKPDPKPVSAKPAITKPIEETISKPIEKVIEVPPQTKPALDLPEPASTSGLPEEESVLDQAVLSVQESIEEEPASDPIANQAVSEIEPVLDLAEPAQPSFLEEKEPALDLSVPSLPEFLEQEAIPSSTSEPEAEAKPEPEPSLELDTQSAEQVLQALLDDASRVEEENKPAEITAELKQSEEKQPAAAAVQPDVKKSKWEELDSLISSQRSSQQKIESIATPKIESVSQESISSDTKAALISAVDNLDTIAIEPGVSAPEAAEGSFEPGADIQSSDSDSNKVEAFPTESRWGDLDAISDSDIEASKEAAREANEAVSTSKWGDLDAIAPPSAARADQSKEFPSESIASKPKWGDLDSIGIDKKFSQASSIHDTIDETSSESFSAGPKWGDLNSIPTPGKSSSPLDSALAAKSFDGTDTGLGKGPGGSIFGDIEGLDQAKLDSDPAAPSSLSSAKWGDESGATSGFGSRTGKLGRTTGSFSQLQADPSENLINKGSQSTKEEEEEEIKLKAMPTPQAQAPNKWTGSGGGASTAVSSSLKAMDGKKSKPLLQKPDVKVSLSFNWNIISYLVASIMALLVMILSYTFYTY